MEIDSQVPWSVRSRLYSVLKVGSVHWDVHIQVLVRIARVRKFVLLVVMCD
jgi:hypothetical protein